MRTSSRSVTRLRWLTEDRVAEVYLVLEAEMDSKGRRWVRIRVPKRPNGLKGWVRDRSLSELYVVRTRLVPGRPSHGCVRVPNAAILRLARLMPVGTPVHIR
jgi:lipoprotein-anchoring transpeptidase ErfK/SrfK